MALKIICEVKVPIFNDDGVQEEVDGNLVEKKQEFYLLHWGLQAQLVNDIPVNETVGVCQNIETGQVFLFHPTSIKIIGKEIKHG